MKISKQDLHFEMRLDVRISNPVDMLGECFQEPPLSKCQDVSMDTPKNDLEMIGF